MDDDWGLLSPRFRHHLERLFAKLRKLGHEPRLADGYRTLEQSKKLSDEGERSQLVGPSMHCYGIAADAICAKHGWDCAKVGCRFFEDLDTWARVANFTRVTLRGKNGQRYLDQPHVQAVPVSVQRFVRTATPQEIDQLVWEYLG